MNSSYGNFDEFTHHARKLVEVLVKQLIHSEVKKIMVVFGDNYRYLIFF